MTVRALVTWLVLTVVSGAVLFGALVGYHVVTEKQAMPNPCPPGYNHLATVPGEYMDPKVLADLHKGLDQAIELLAGWQICSPSSNPRP